MRVVRLLTGIAGLVGVVLAIPVFVAGVGLLWWTADGAAELPTVAIHTDARAYVATDIDTMWSDPAFPIPQARHAMLTVTGEEPLFVGIGPATAVRRFVATSDAPADQDFWITTSEGATADLGWDVEPGRWTVVVMNTDGSRGVSADVRAGLPVAPIRLAGGILTGVGLAIGAVGSLVMAAAWGRGPRHRTAGVPATV